MKRFKWPLQRLLDVTAQREHAARAELAALTLRMSGIRDEIHSRRMVLAAGLADLGKMEFQQRVVRLDLFMRCSVPQERRMAKLGEQLAGLETQRAAKTQQYMRLRNSTRTLEGLRGDALAGHRREMSLEEQRQFDQTAQSAHARRILAARVSARQESA